MCFKAGINLNLLLIFIFVLLAAGCESDVPARTPEETTYDFESGTEGWESIFADYPVGREEQLELIFEHSPLPEPLDGSRMALKISGRNTSDDLFMGIMKKITSLDPEKSYSVVFEISLASNAPESSFGVGGSPGASVYLKAGAVSFKPERITDENNWYRLNIDKGNQAADGEDMVNLGNAGIPGEEFIYTLIAGSNAGQPIEMHPDQNGDLWLIVGTDSGFESTTTLYYDEIKVSIR